MSRLRSRTMRILAAAALLLALSAGAAAAALWWTFLRDLPDFTTLADYRPPLATTVLDRHGVPIGEFYEFRRRLTTLDDVPQHVVEAFLAAEDDAFYQHSGVDYASIVRAAWANFRAGGETVQGASTITQQMVKQLLLSPERTYRRKIRELILARRIEQRFSKDEILFLYLNQIYFGSGAYGVGEAARTYFGKAVPDVTVGEAALLAGLPKAPGRNSPFVDVQAAEARRRYVLERMREEGFLDEAAWREAVATPPALVPEAHRDPAVVASAYLVEDVRKALVERLGNDLVLRGGLTVETTLDAGLQREAHAAVRAGLEALDRRQGYRGPERRVAPEALDAELARLAEANGLAGPPAPGLPTDPVARLLAAEGPRPAVVLAVDGAAGDARVGFAPGVEADVRFDDVDWARRADTPRWKTVKRIDQVLAVGDVAGFLPERAENDAEEEDGAAEAPDDAAAEATPRLRARLAQEPRVEGALLSFEIATGEVLALVGGYDFARSEFDRATQAQRQPGSAFKPLIYTTALTRGYTPASILYDRPVVYEDASTGFVWRPENYGRRFLGPLTLSEALARSVNNATIHLMRELGVEAVIATSQRLGIESTVERTLATALGVSSMTLLELTRAYAHFPSGGVRVEPVFVRRVLDRDGRVLLEDLTLDPTPPPPPSLPAPEPGAVPAVAAAAAPAAEEPAAGAPGRALAPEDAFLATTLLRSVVEHPKGTGGKARALGHPVGGKTGTTNDQADAWFVGFSPEIATGVWVGFDEKELLGPGETGGRAALPIWIEFMEDALAAREPGDFTVPPGIVFARVDGRSGLLASGPGEDTVLLAFREGTEPRQQADARLSPAERERSLRLDF